MRVKSRNHSIDSLFSFLLLLIFCLFTLMLAGMGSTIYRNGAAYLDENYTSRTAVAYISEKVRQHDTAGAVFLTSIRASSGTGEASSSDISGESPAQTAGSVLTKGAQASDISGESPAQTVGSVPTKGAQASDMSGESPAQTAGSVPTKGAQTAGADVSGELPALGFLDEIEGNSYVTYVYFYDNALCELMIQKDRTPEAAMGNRIVKLSSLSIEKAANADLLTVTVASEEGNTLSELIHVSSGLEEWRAS